jgi:tetratricopeptide (TPR) repeat protein
MKKVFIAAAFFTTLGITFLYYCHALAQEGEQLVDTSQLFLQANQAYKAADFNSAAQFYEKIVSAGTVNGELFYNMGNAYLKSGRVGKAILNYRKAEMHMPRDEDLGANLDYACGFTRDKIECKELLSFIKKFCFWYSKLNTNELAAFFLIVNFVFWTILTLRIFFKGEILAITMYIFIFLTLVLGASFGVKIYNFYLFHSGVVVAKEIMVRSGNSINDTVLFKLHEGTEFTWVQENAGWVKIRLCDGKKGWVQEKVVERIN